MTDRRSLLGAAGAGLILAAAHPARALAPGAPCGPTASATAGPFYVAGTPFGENINLLGMTGTPLRISGRVLGGGDGRQPLAGARVELWQADAAGRYHPEAHGDMSAFPAGSVTLRGQQLCDAEGRFRFSSILPGRYGPRRRHLHWRVRAAGHRELVTQTYWLEERGSAAERSDPVDRAVEDCRWIDFRMQDGISHGEVLLVLQPLHGPA